MSNTLNALAVVFVPSFIVRTSQSPEDTATFIPPQKIGSNALFRSDDRSFPKNCNREEGRRKEKNGSCKRKFCSQKSAPVKLIVGEVCLTNVDVKISRDSKIQRERSGNSTINQKSTNKNSQNPKRGSSTLSNSQNKCIEDPLRFEVNTDPDINNAVKKAQDVSFYTYNAEIRTTVESIRKSSKGRGSNSELGTPSASCECEGNSTVSSIKITRNKQRRRDKSATIAEHPANSRTHSVLERSLSLSSPYVIEEAPIDQFPCLPESACSSSSYLTTSALAVKPALSAKPYVLSYLALASKHIRDDETEANTNLTPDTMNSSWYYSNADQKLSPSSALSRASDTSADDCNDAHTSPSRPLFEQDSGVEFSKTEAGTLAMSAATAVARTSGCLGRAATTASRGCDLSGRVALMHSGSKSAADRWKGRWLQIARLQSALQREKLQKLSAHTSVQMAATQKDWHNMLAQEVEKSSPYSYTYSSAKVAPTVQSMPTHQISSDIARAAVAVAGQNNSLTTQFMTFQWWTAVHAGDHAVLLTLLSSGRFKFEVCFCYPTYISDCHAILENTTRLEDLADAEKLLYNVAAAHLKRASIHYSEGVGGPVQGSGPGFRRHYYSQEDQGLSAIHMCAKLSHPVCLDYLLRAASAGGADSRDRINKLTPLHIACHMGDLECVKILLLHGADPECRDKHGDTALHKACSSSSSPASQAALVAFLCERSKSNSTANGGSLRVNTKNKKRETALMFARTRDLAVLLIGAGADPLCVSSEGLDAASMAARRGDSKVLEAILGCNYFRQAPVSAASGVCTSGSRAKNVEAVQSNFFTTPLHEAAKTGSLSCVRIMLSARYCSDLDRVDRPGDSTPLMLACAAGHTRIVQELLGKAADTEVEDRRGVTAVVLAARSGHLSCVRSIISAKPDSIHRKNSVGETVLEMIARVLRQDLLCSRPITHAPAATSLCVVAGPAGVDELDHCLECITALIMNGGQVTERFLRRFSSFETIEQMQALKLSRTQHTPSAPHEHLKSTVAMVFEAEVCGSRCHVPPPCRDYCDVTFLLADGEECVAHSFMLCAGSVVLKAMLQSDMLTHLEDTEMGLSVVSISLPHHSKACFLLLLEWMYSRTDVTMTLNLAFSDDQAMLLDLLYLSNELLITPLQRLCEDKIGKNLERFSKHSVLSLGLSLDLQLLLTCYWNFYPPSSSLDGSDDSFPLQNKFYADWEAAANSRTDSDSDSLLVPDIWAVDADWQCEDVIGKWDQSWARGRKSIMDGRSVTYFLATCKDSEWYRWLAAPTATSSVAVDLAAAAVGAAAVGVGVGVGVPEGNLRSSLDLHDGRAHTSQYLEEDSLTAWWFRAMILAALGPPDRPGGAVNRDKVLLGALPFLQQSCSGLVSTAAREDSKSRADDCFDYSVVHPIPPTPVDPGSSFLLDLAPDDRLMAMLTNLHRCTISVNLLPHSIPSGDEDNNGESAGFSESQAAEAALEVYTAGILVQEPFVALHTQRLFTTLPPLPAFHIDRALARLGEMTPPCVQLQQLRAALLCRPETSSYDVLIILVSSIQGPDSECNDAQEEDAPAEMWDTRGNSRYTPHNWDAERKGEEVLLVIPAHRAILAAGSGKFAAMIRFSAVQAEACASSERTKGPMSVLEIHTDRGVEARDDLKDLVWYIYTGVLRERETEKCVEIGSSLISASPSMTVLPHSSVEVDKDVRATRLLRLLWLADEYLMHELSLLLEQRMLQCLAPQCASSFFMGAQALGLRALSLCAAVCVLYSTGASTDGSRDRRTDYNPNDTHNHVTPSDPHATDLDTRDAQEVEGEDQEVSSAFVLLEILRTLSLKPR